MVAAHLSARPPRRPGTLWLIVIVAGVLVLALGAALGLYLLRAGVSVLAWTDPFAFWLGFPLALGGGALAAICIVSLGMLVMWRVRGKQRPPQ